MKDKEIKKQLDQGVKEVKGEGHGCKCTNCACKKKDHEKKKEPVKLASLVLLLFLSTTAFAQETTAQQTFWDDPFNHPLLPMYLMLAFVGVTVILVAVVLIYVTRFLNLISKQMEMERAEKLGLTITAKPSWWENMWNRLNSSVPVADETSIDLGHNFDGIRELDNHLPPWWKGLFYVTIVWSIVYFIAYHVIDSLPLSDEEYRNELAVAEKEARALKASQPKETIDESTLVYTNNAEIIQKGKLVFSSSNCGSCHRGDGGGSTIGPNLTDEYWLHGGAVKNVFSTINKGVVEKGMPAWGKVMSPQDVRNLTFYILSLQGSSPKDAKAPQGEKYIPEKQKTQTDTTKVQTSLK